MRERDKFSLVMRTILQIIYKRHLSRENSSAVNMRGGKGIPVYCDHSNMEEVEELFKKIEKEQKGRLNVLVNNAYSGGKVKFLSCLLKLVSA